MAKYFEITVSISKRVFLKAEDHETCDSVQDYIHDSNTEQLGEVEVEFPVEMETKEEIERSERHCDEKISNC